MGFATNDNERQRTTTNASAAANVIRTTTNVSAVGVRHGYTAKRFKDSAQGFNPGKQIQ
jgi:hypothetical protein